MTIKAFIRTFKVRLIQVKVVTPREEAILSKKEEASKEEEGRMDNISNTDINKILEAIITIATGTEVVIVDLLESFMKILTKNCKIQ